MLPKPPLLIAAALLLAFFSGAVVALGLGGMRTQSALNQPFYAEIELNGIRSDEIDTVKARLASRDEFAKAGAERPHFLTRLQFASAIGTDGRPYIQVSSREPIREPYIDFLVEVLWPQGRLVKEYTVLLDPPARGSAPPPRVVPPRTSVARRRPPPEQAPPPPLRRSARPQQETRQPAPAAPPSRQAPALVPAAARGTRFPLYYGPVPRGATLTRIARELTPPGATLEQTAMALFRNNQGAFSRGNINLLRVGKDLVVPTAEELFALDQGAARRQFQDAVVGRSVDTSPITDIPSDVRLRIAGGGEAPASTPPGALPPAALPGAAGPAPGQVAGVDPALRQDLLIVQETTESNRQETTELRRRISELEAQLADIQRLLQLRNEQLAQLQERAAIAEPGALPLPPALRPAGAGIPEQGSIVESAAPPPAHRTIETQAGAGEELGTADVPPAQPVVEPGIGMVGPDGSVEELLPPPAAGMVAEPADTAADAVPETTAALDETAVGPVAQEGAGAGDQPSGAGAWGTLGGVARALPPWVLAAAAGTLALGGAGLYAYRRRQRQPAEDEEAETEAAGLAVPSEPLPDAGSKPGFEVKSTTLGEADLDTLPDLDSEGPSQSLGTSADAPTDAPAIDVQTGLPIGVVSNIPPTQQETQDADVIAEADIYILYGRYREAEALLREELERAPGQRDLKYKLGEALLGTGSRAALAELLERMRAAGDDKRDPAKWASLEAGLAGLGTGDEEDAPTAPPPRIKPLGEATTKVSPEQVPTGEAAQSTDLLGDSEDTELGFSVREVTPSSAERLREQMSDLELDLQEMDDFGANLDSSQASDAPSSRPAYSEDAPQARAPSPRGERPGGGRLDLDLDDLEQRAATPQGAPPIDLTLPVPGESQDPGGALDPYGGDELAGDSRTPLPDPLAATATQGAPTEVYEESAEAAPVQDSISSDVLSSQWRMDTGLWDEAGTKLDLARAYIEMDDPDAARAILEEVVQEGTEAQRSDAAALLAKIG